MPRKRLAVKFCQTVKPAAKQVEFWDTTLTGLSLLVHPGGRKTFCTKFRTHAKQHRRQIGPFPVVSLDEARERARDILSNAARGIDSALAPEAPRSVADLSRLYIEHRSRNSKSTIENARMHSRFIVAELGRIPLAQMRSDDLRGLVQKIGEATPVQANRVLAEIKTMMN